MSSKDVATVEKGSIVPKLVLYGLAALGAWLIIRWLFGVLSFVFTMTFWVVVLAIAVVVLWIKLRSSRSD